MTDTSPEAEWRQILADEGMGAIRLLASVRSAPSGDACGPAIDLVAEMGEEEAQTAAVILAWMAVVQERRVELLEGELRRLRDLVPELDIAIIDWVLHG